MYFILLKHTLFLLLLQEMEQQLFLDIQMAVFTPTQQIISHTKRFSLITLFHILWAMDKTFWQQETIKKSLSMIPTVMSYKDSTIHMSKKLKILQLLPSILQEILQHLVISIVFMFIISTQNVDSGKKILVNKLKTTIL